MHAVAGTLAALAPQAIAGTALRLVESQEQIATLHIVDSVAEQGILETILERSKPKPPNDCAGLHYLLATPFRYPPLPHGSRFGNRLEPGLFYGALANATAFAEGAYYRFCFWHGMETPPAHRLTTQHTLFAARYATARGVRLQEPPGNAHRAVWRDPSSYAATQQLGTGLRERGIEGLEYESARDPQAGLCVVLFTPRALQSRRPEEQSSWLCETTGTSVVYGAGQRLYRFGIEAFLVEGVLPTPAF